MPTRPHWWLDFVHRGDRHVARIGSNINRTVAKELASVERAKVLRSAAGIGRKPKDIAFEDAKKAFLEWAETNLKPNTLRGYTASMKQLEESALFAGKRLSQISKWTVEPLRTVILVGIHAGLRIDAEALSLRWPDVDLKRGRDFVGKRSGDALENIRNAFEHARDKASLGSFTVRNGKRAYDVTPHTLRHTFASRLAMAGFDLRTIQELGGWKTLSLVQRYAHLSPRHKADAVEAIAKIPRPISQQRKFCDRVSIEGGVRN